MTIKTPLPLVFAALVLVCACALFGHFAPALVVLANLGVVEAAFRDGGTEPA